MAGEKPGAAIQDRGIPLPGTATGRRAGVLAPSRMLHLARRKPLGAVALAVLLVLWGACLLAPALAPFGYDQIFTAPRLSSPSAEHWFGTDESGRDVLSRLLYGGRLSLTLSLAATLAGVALAVAVGVTSGYAAGWFDLIFQRLSDAVQSLPTLVILLVLAALFKGDPVIVLLAVALLFAPAGGRLFRSVTLTLRGQPFVESARVIGATPLRI